MRNDTASVRLAASRRALRDRIRRIFDDFNDAIMTPWACEREALIEVDLIRGSLKVPSKHERRICVVGV